MLHFPDKILAQLKMLYSEFRPTASEDGTPRIIAFCISRIKADAFSVSVATSKDIWMPGSFLHQCVRGLFYLFRNLWSRRGTWA